jgi:hypothetical protein
LSGLVDIYNNAGFAHVIADVFGYFVGGVTLGFDTCTLPTLQQMAVWKTTSWFSSANVYFGGGARACAPAELQNPAWVDTVIAQGWQLIPTYVGRQAPCTTFSFKIDPPVAATQGVEAANDAAATAQAAGILPPAPLYFDMEWYDVTIPGCSTVVKQFISAYVAQLHQYGYQAGLYSSLSAGIADEVAAVGQGYAVVDALWIAAWNNTLNIYGFGPTLPDGLWDQHQRIHQYMGGHDEFHGGVTLNIDSNVVDGPVAP